MTTKVLMLPHISHITKMTSGIDQVVHYYFKHLPQFGIKLVHPDSGDFDLIAGHVGQGSDLGGPYVTHIHGLHWTADYPYGPSHYRMNERIIEACRNARDITVPSRWVAESFQRDMRMKPAIVPHGIEWDAWQHDGTKGDFVLWNKNRNIGVCDPTPVVKLAKRFPRQHLVTTFLPHKSPGENNISVTGSIPHPEMKKLVQASLVYLSTTKETFGIGTLEAMAAGVPVLGFNSGGNVEIVQHGVTGYLANEGDYDDLAEGLLYCLKHRRTLGANAREAARAWTWEEAAKQVALVYNRAIEPDPPTVGIVIPVYNKPDEEIERAILSAIQQTHKLVKRIVIVDDGSNDGERIKALADRYSGDERIEYVRQANQGVAIARNTGIKNCDTKYICCLDSDDWIQPEFIETCVQALEKDPALGIAYTGLHFVRPDGKEGLSAWPGEFNYDQQMKGHNQIPTCCVFRRIAWERTGGYRQRYAPRGAGEEDAEFWLRLGAYGWNAEKVDPRGLFVYSWQSGLVSGNSQHAATDWTAWHPWVEDGQHPFASVATPKRISHPVRQYDEPEISVIIPVGPGHEKHLYNALDSLEAQTLRKWEAIVVFDTGNEYYPEISGAYPYIKPIYTDRRGPGHARNRGTEIARAPLIVFLDADDWLYPKALERMLDEWNNSQAIIYTDYTGRAYVNDPKQLDPKLQERMYYYDQRTNTAIIGYRAAEYDCQKAQAQPDGPKPWVWCNVTSLIPLAWHNNIGGFDESMESWEDVDYHWRMAKAGYCYRRLPEELLVYNFHQGHRRERGLQDYKNLLYYLIEKHRGIEIMGCSSCGGRRRTPPTAGAFSSAAKSQPQLDDSDFLQVNYIHPNRGDHQVTGSAIFDHKIEGFRMIRRGRNGWSIDYGYRPGGGAVQFLVHRKDVESQPHYFQPVKERGIVNPPRAERKPLEEPKPISKEVAEVLDEVIEPDDPTEVGDILNPVEKLDLQMLPGVGGALARELEAREIDSAEKLLALGVDGLRQIPGVGEVKAERILKAVMSRPQ